MNNEFFESIMAGLREAVEDAKSTENSLKRNDRMTKVVFVDEKTGEVFRTELEFTHLLSGEMEIETLKRRFAERLVNDEWLEMGKVDYGLEKGVVLLDDGLTNTMRHSAEQIGREKYIRVIVIK